MDYNKPIVEAKFVKRPNRFQGYVILNEKELMVHVPNTGRCKEILTPNTTVFLREENNPTRKTPYDLIAAYKGKELISIDSHIPNKVVEEALLNGKIQELKAYNKVSREKTFGNSRFDFKLENDNGEIYYLEVKGVTLEENGIARFPDAPTERWRKHLLELIEVKKLGMGAGVLLLIQMENVHSFTTNDETDPDFGKAMRIAKKNGVQVMSYNCKVTKNSIELLHPVEVIL